MPLRLVLGAAVLIAAGYACAFGGPGVARLGAWLLAVGLAVLMPATIALGAPRHGRAGRVVQIALWATFLELLGAFGAALALPPSEEPGAALLFGLPLRAAIVLYGAGVIPLLGLPFVYAWAFTAREPVTETHPPGDDSGRAGPA